MLHSTATAKRRILKDGGVPYSDPLLKRRGYDLGHLIGSLWKRGMLVQGSASVYKVGLFCVPRKGGLQRLIVGPHFANLACHRPPRIDLPSSGRSLLRLEVDTDQRLQFHSGDVAVCFYQYLLPDSLQHLFGL